MKKTIFWIKNISPNVFPRTPRMQFRKFRRNVFKKKSDFFQSVSLTDKERKKKSKNPSKFSKGHVEGDFDNPTLKNVNKRQKLFRSMSKIEMKKTFLRISVFLGNVRMESSFGSSAEIFLTITEKFSLNHYFFWKTSFCWEKNFFFLEMFLWTRSYKIWQPRRNNSGRDLTTLQQRPKVMK